MCAGLLWMRSSIDRPVVAPRESGQWLPQYAGVDEISVIGKRRKRSNRVVVGAGVEVDSTIGLVPVQENAVHGGDVPRGMQRVGVCRLVEGVVGKREFPLVGLELNHFDHRFRKDVKRFDRDSCRRDVRTEGEHQRAAASRALATQTAIELPHLPLTRTRPLAAIPRSIPPPIAGLRHRFGR